MRDLDEYADLRDDDETLEALDRLVEETAGDDVGDDVAEDVVGGDDADAFIDASARVSERNRRRAYTGRVADDGEPDDGPFIDDFTQMRIRAAEARREFPGDDLAQQAAVRKAELGEYKENVVDPAPKVDGMPPSWTSAIVGGSATVSPGQQPQEVATWVGKNLESRPISVVFGPANQATSGGISGDTLQPFLRLQFGTERGLITVDIDIGTGGQVVVPGNVVHALVGLSTGGTLSYTLNVVMGYFAIARTSQLTRTDNMNNLLNGSGQRQNFTRPLFATAVWLERTLQGGSTPEIQLDFLDLQAVTRYSQVVAANTYLSQPIPLSNDVVSIDVTNNGVACQARLIWVLNL